VWDGTSSHVQATIIRFIPHATRKKLWLQRSDLNRELSEKNRGIRIHLPQGGTTVSNTVALRAQRLHRPLHLVRNLAAKSESPCGLGRTKLVPGCYVHAELRERPNGYGSGELYYFRANVGNGPKTRHGTMGGHAHFFANSTNFGFPIGVPGITVNASAVSPSGHPGTYEWAQLITTNTHSNTPGTPCSTGTGLDNQFPTSVGLSFSDSPGTTLKSPYTKATWNLGFTSYLMWKPGLSSTDIPAPLGYLTWTGFGDATLSGTVWSVQPDSGSAVGSFVPSSAYPIWTNTVVNGSNTCASQSQ
jgi:hypothetical protein